MAARKAQHDHAETTILTGAMGYDVLKKTQFRYVSSFGGAEGDKTFTLQAKGQLPEARVAIYGDGASLSPGQALMLAERLIQFARTGSIAGSLYS